MRDEGRTVDLRQLAEELVDELDSIADDLVTRGEIDRGAWVELTSRLEHHVQQRLAQIERPDAVTLH